MDGRLRTRKQERTTPRRRTGTHRRRRQYLNLSPRQNLQSRQARPPPHPPDLAQERTADLPVAALNRQREVKPFKPPNSRCSRSSSRFNRPWRKWRKCSACWHRWSMSGVKIYATWNHCAAGWTNSKPFAAIEGHVPPAARFEPRHSLTPFMSRASFPVPTC